MVSEALVAAATAHALPKPVWTLFLSKDVHIMVGSVSETQVIFRSNFDISRNGQ